MSDAGAGSQPIPSVSARPSGRPSPQPLNRLPRGITADARSVASRLVLLVAVLGLIFVVVLPRIVDYGDVAAALEQLTPAQLTVLVLITLVAYVTNAAACRILVDGLSWRRAVAADLAGRAVASTIPGPTDVATKFVLYRQWRIPADTASAGIVFGAFFETLSSLILPLIAVVGVVASGNTNRPGVVSLAILGSAILAVATIVLVAIVRSAAMATRVGLALDWLASRLWRLVHRAPPQGILDAVLDVRVRSQDILSRHGVLGFVGAVAAKLAWFVVLERALWAVGIGWDVLPPSSVLVAMALVAIVALIPITPGAVGITEVAYIGLLSTVAGDGYTDEITAAVMLFRLAQWLAPIPIGWTLLILMRRRRSGGLLRGDPVSAATTATTAPVASRPAPAELTPDPRPAPTGAP